MSNGAQIGGIIGAAIGGYITMSPQGAQMGYMIGSTEGCILAISDSEDEEHEPT